MNAARVPATVLFVNICCDFEFAFTVTLNTTVLTLTLFFVFGQLDLWQGIIFTSFVLIYLIFLVCKI